MPLRSLDELSNHLVINDIQRKILECLKYPEFVPNSRFDIVAAIREQSDDGYGWGVSERDVQALVRKGLLIPLSAHVVVVKTENFSKDLEEYLAVYMDAALSGTEDKRTKRAANNLLHILNELGAGMTYHSLISSMSSLGYLVCMDLAPNGFLFSKEFCLSLCLLLTRENIVRSWRVRRALNYLLSQFCFQERDEDRFEELTAMFNGKYEAAPTEASKQVWGDFLNILYFDEFKASLKEPTDVDRLLFSWRVKKRVGAQSTGN